MREEKTALVALPGAWRANRRSRDCCPSAGLRKLRNNDEDGADCGTDRPWRKLDIEIAHVQRIVFDKLPARFDHVTHQNREHFVGIDGVIVIQVHF